MKRRIDEAEFIAAYDAYADAIFRYCYFKTYDRERAKELMQETFFKAWEYLAKGREIENLRAFLYRTAHNLSVNEAVRHKAYSIDEMHEVAGFDPEDTQEASPEEESERQLVMRALRTLEPKDRELLVMRYVDDLPVKEIATALGVPPNTVSVRLKRALERLKEHLHIP